MDVATEEWMIIKNESSHLRDHYGRIPDRMGCSDGPTVHTRQMDGHREIESHQLSGIESCFVCTSAMEKSDYSPIYTYFIFSGLDWISKPNQDQNYQT